jgi:carbon monoxide dehydrogenase subunit G
MKLQMTGKFFFEAPIEEVWSFLFDIEALTHCMPGVEEIRAIDDKNYVGIIKQKVGPISARFEFTTSLKEVVPLQHIKAVGRGSDKGIIGPFSHEIVVDLTEVSKDQVEIAYDVNVDIASIPFFGKTILESRAKSLEKEFTTNLKEKLRSLKAQG